MKTFYDVPNTVVDLKEAIADQPVSVGIEADKQSFQFYKSGVYDDVSCGNQLDHGVIAVGYGSEDDKGYFLVRNSWGGTWGDQVSACRTLNQSQYIMRVFSLFIV